MELPEIKSHSLLLNRNVKRHRQHAELNVMQSLVELRFCNRHEHDINEMRSTIEQINS